MNYVQIDLLLTRRIVIFYIPRYGPGEGSSIKRTVERNLLGNADDASCSDVKFHLSDDMNQGDLSHLTNDQRIALVNQGCELLCYTNLTGTDNVCTGDVGSAVYAGSTSPPSSK